MRMERWEAHCGLGQVANVALGRLMWADGPKMEENSTPWPKTMVGNCRTPSDPAVLNSGHGNILKVVDTGLTTSVSDLLPVPRQPRPIYEAPVACSGFRDHRPLVMMVPMTAAVKRKRNVQRQPAWDRTKLCDALAAWKDWKRTCNEGGEISRDPLVELALQFQNDLEQHLLRKLSGLTPMQAFNTIEHAVVEVGLQYFAAPSRRGGRRQPTLTSPTLALVRQKQQLAREMARRRHETWSPLEAEALRANHDEAAKQARTAVKKDKISNLESLARTAEEAHKDRDLEQCSG